MSVLDRASRLVIVIAVLILLAGPVRSASPPARTADDRMETLVTTEWLSRHLDDPDLVVLDCTVQVKMGAGGIFTQESGRTDYERGHIPTAGFADLTGDLCREDSPLDFALPTPERFRIAMAKLGVGDDSRVVLYDGMNSSWAARVWWMLRWVGFDRAAVLDGGLRVWTAEERPLSTEPANDQPAQPITLALRPTLVAERDEVAAAIDDDDVILIDTMPAPHFAGQMVLYDRPGHIPSAINVPVTSLIDESGRFLPSAELSALYSGNRDDRIITYCGGGIAASAYAFVLTRLGFPDVAVYTASLQEWAADPDNPLVVGE